MVPLRFFRGLVAPATLAAALACGGDDLVLPSDGQPAQIETVKGDEQVGSAGIALGDSLVVRLLDQRGRGVGGQRVVFELGDGATGGDVSPDTAVTDSRGLAGSSWTLGENAGAQVVDARVVGAALTVRFTASAGSSTAARIEAVSGDGQSAPVGTELPDPLVVRVLDQFGNPVEGVGVAWSAGAGEVSPGTVETDADGLAAARRTLGFATGDQSAEAAVPGLEGSPVVFTHTATPGSADQLKLVSGNGQEGPAGEELDDPLVVQLVDQAGNGIPDRAVTWIVTTGAGGSVSPESGTTDGEGFASARWTLASAPGDNTLNAVVSGVGIVPFTARGTGGGGGGTEPSANRSTVSADPASITALTGTSTITVTVRDGNGTPVAGATVSLEATGAGNTLTQPSGPAGADGIATGTLRSAVPGTKVITATVNGSLEINQNAQVVVSVAPASRIDELEGDGQSAPAGEPVPIRPAVRVTNALGQPVAGIGVTFAVTSGGGSVSGGSQTTNSDGVARVGSWTLGAAGSNTLEARAGSLDGSPVVFTATATAVPDHLVFRVQPGDVDRRELFSPPVEVAILDAAGNVMPLDGVEIRLELLDDRGRDESNRLSGNRTAGTVAGIAVFTGLGVNQDDEDFRLRASSPDFRSVPAVVSESFDVD